MKTRGPAKQAAYLLPLDLIRRVKDEAHAEDVWPAHVVAERLRHSFAVSPKLPRHHKAPGAAVTS